MPPIPTNQYHRQLEDLVARAVLYFDASERTADRTIQPRKLQGFLSEYGKQRGLKSLPQPGVVSRLLDRLAEIGVLRKTRSGGLDGLDNDYLTTQPSELLNDIRDSKVAGHLELVRQFNMMAFGFPVILDYFKDIALPIEYTGINKDTRSEFRSLGTVFWSPVGLITAKHCIAGGTRLAIKGIDGASLRAAKVLIPRNPDLDLAIIQPPSTVVPPIPMPQFANADLLEEVLAIGYPNVPGYHNFCAGEIASVASRYTGSRGSAAAVGKDIWLKTELLLITARIRGGNSGGPVVSRLGRVVGIAVNMPLADGGRQYDDMGYGVVIPASLVQKQLDEGQFESDGSVAKLFVDFEE